MRKLSLELDVEKKVEKLVKKVVNEHRLALILYCIGRLGVSEPDARKLTVGFEPVKNYSKEMYTVRYDGQLLFREYKTGTAFPLLNRRYELAKEFE